MTPWLTWTCHVCGADRPDALISVATATFTIRAAEGRVNRRYCNDRPACEAAARDMAARMADRLGVC